MRKKIENGLHELTGIGTVAWTDEYSGDYIEGVVIQIDGANYSAFRDPSDGWRSYGCLCLTDHRPSVMFPAEKVLAVNESEDGMDDAGWPVNYEILKLFNEDGELVLEIGTDHSDAYYPIGIFHWYPSKLKINKGK